MAKFIPVEPEKWAEMVKAWAENVRLETENGQLQTELARLKALTSEMDKTINASQAECRRLKEKSECQAECLEAFDKENARLKAECQARQAENSVLAVECDSLKAEVERVTEQVAGLIVSLQKSHDEHGDALYKLKYKNERKTSRKKRGS